MTTRMGFASVLGLMWVLGTLGVSQAVGIATAAEPRPQVAARIG